MATDVQQGTSIDEKRAPTIFSDEPDALHNLQGQIFGEGQKETIDRLVEKFQNNKSPQTFFELLNTQDIDKIQGKFGKLFNYYKNKLFKDYNIEHIKDADLEAINANIQEEPNSKIIVFKTNLPLYDFQPMVDFINGLQGTEINDKLKSSLSRITGEIGSFKAELYEKFDVHPNESEQSIKVFIPRLLKSRRSNIANLPAKQSGGVSDVINTDVQNISGIVPVLSNIPADAWKTVLNNNKNLSATYSLQNNKFDPSGATSVNIENEYVQYYFTMCDDLQQHYINNHIKIYAIFKKIIELIDYNEYITEEILKLLNPKPKYVSGKFKVLLKSLLKDAAKSFSSSKQMSDALKSINEKLPSTESSTQVGGAGESASVSSGESASVSSGESANTNITPQPSPPSSQPQTPTPMPQETQPFTFPVNNSKAKKTYAIEGQETFDTFKIIENIESIVLDSIKNIKDKGGLQGALSEYEKSIKDLTEKPELKSNTPKWTTFYFEQKPTAYFNFKDEYKNLKSDDPDYIQRVIYRCYDLQILYLVQYLNMVLMFKVMFYYLDMLVKKVGLILFVLDMYRLHRFEDKVVKEIRSVALPIGDLIAPERDLAAKLRGGGGSGTPISSKKQLLSEITKLRNQLGTTTDKYIKQELRKKLYVKAYEYYTTSIGDKPSIIKSARKASQFIKQSSSLVKNDVGLVSEFLERKELHREGLEKTKEIQDQINETMKKVSVIGQSCSFKGVKNESELKSFNEANSVLYALLIKLNTSEIILNSVNTYVESLREEYTKPCVKMAIYMDLIKFINQDNQNLDFFMNIEQILNNENREYLTKYEQIANKVREKVNVLDTLVKTILKKYLDETIASLTKKSNMPEPTPYGETKVTRPYEIVTISQNVTSQGEKPSKATPIININSNEQYQYIVKLHKFNETLKQVAKDEDKLDFLNRKTKGEKFGFEMNEFVSVLDNCTEFVGRNAKPNEDKSKLIKDIENYVEKNKQNFMKMIAALQPLYELIMGAARVLFRLRGGAGDKIVENIGQFPQCSLKLTSEICDTTQILDPLYNKDGNYGPFLNVYTETVNTEDIYGNLFNENPEGSYQNQNLMAKLEGGNNVVIFGYGYSGSGKSFTLLNNTNSILNTFLSNRKDDIESIDVQEIYRRTEPIKHNQIKNIQNIQEIQKSLAAIDLKRRENMRILATPNNKESSRGFLQITVNLKLSPEGKQRGKLVLFDMPGTENLIRIKTSYFGTDIFNDVKKESEKLYDFKDLFKVTEEKVVGNEINIGKNTIKITNQNTNAQEIINRINANTIAILNQALEIKYKYEGAIFKIVSVKILNIRTINENKTLFKSIFSILFKYICLKVLEFQSLGFNVDKGELPKTRPNQDSTELQIIETKYAFIAKQGIEIAFFINGLDLNPAYEDIFENVFNLENDQTIYFMSDDVCNKIVKNFKLIEGSNKITLQATDLVKYSNEIFDLNIWSRNSNIYESENKINLNKEANLISTISKYTNSLDATISYILDYLSTKTSQTPTIINRAKFFFIYKYIKFICEQGRDITTSLEHLKYFFLYRINGIGDYNTKVYQQSSQYPTLINKQFVLNFDNDQNIIDNPRIYSYQTKITDKVSMTEYVNMGEMVKYHVIAELQKLAGDSTELDKIKNDMTQTDTYFDGKTQTVAPIPNLAVNNTGQQKPVFIMLAHMKNFIDNSTINNPALAKIVGCNAAFDTLEFAQSLIASSVMTNSSLAGGARIGKVLKAKYKYSTMRRQNRKAKTVSIFKRRTKKL